MEDFRDTEEDQSSPVSQKVCEGFLKESPPPSPLNCVTLRSSSTPALSPSPAPDATALPPVGEDNEKKTTVANVQISSSVSVWRTAREVPPRFRNHQEPKILLKRGQSLEGVPSLLHTGDRSNVNTSHCSAFLSYANSTCGPGSKGPPSSQEMDRIVVDGSELQTWSGDADSRRQNEFLKKASWEPNESMQKNSESVSPPSCGTPLNPAESECMQQKIQIEDGDQNEKKERGPKQEEADAADPCKGLNSEALILDTCSSKTSGKLLETGDTWGTSGKSDEISQRAWEKQGEQAATAHLNDVPKEAEGKEKPPDCLQVNQTTTDSERQWERSECKSVGHRGSEGGTQTSCTEVTLQSMLSRSDLDPRVFSNTGWGQTQIKQSVAWDFEVDSSSKSGRDWTKHGQVDLRSSSCPQWSRGLQGTGSKEEQNKKKANNKHALLPVGGNSWVEVVEEEQVERCDGNRKDNEQQREGERGRQGLADNQWGENKDRSGQGEKSWVKPEDEGFRSKEHQGWGDSCPLQHIPNDQTALKDSNQLQIQQSQLQCTSPGASLESRNPHADPVTLNQSAAWKPGSLSHTASHAASHTEPSGWEEPSPQSISRKIEVDDGTSAWGDPAHYDKKSVNMWDKSNLQQRSQPCQQQQESGADTTLTNRDKNTAWEQRAGASEPVPDNSTAGWGKSFDAPSGWRDPEKSGKGAEWSSSLCSPAKTGLKTMQNGWCAEGSNTSHRSSWEEEDNSSGMWDRRSKDITSSFSYRGWNQTQAGRRTGVKGSLRGDAGGSWTSSINRQMSNVGMTDEETMLTSDRSRRWVNDFNGEMRRGGRGGGGSYRSHSSKEPGVTSVFNSRGMQQHQPGVHHINSSPGVPAQVPQPFLSPQVSGSVLNPMFPSQLSPQQLAMLSGIHPHVQQVQLAHQLLMQPQHFLSNRKFPPPPPLQHQDPQQLARIMALLQQCPKTPSSFPGPVKLRGDSSYPHYDLVEVENMGVASPGLIDNWHQKPAGKLSPAPSTSTWPPEFQPGVPWKGVQSPEPNPNPYSAMLEENTLTDTEHHLLQDNAVSLSEMNSVLPSPGAWPYCASDTHNPVKFPVLTTGWPPEPIGHRTNRNSSQLPRPPPGLTHQKQSSWLGVGPHMSTGWSSERQESIYSTENSWSAESSTGSSWLLLSNLTPQIDGATLKTICLQHGPLMTFNLGLAQGSALIRYCSPEEAAKAQSSLHMCVLGNTTILAEFVSEEDVARYFTHSQSRETGGDRETDRETESETGGGEEVKLGWENLDGVGLSLFTRWSHSRVGGVWGGAASGYHGNNLWASPQVEDRGPGLLPGNLLGGGAKTL